VQPPVMPDPPEAPLEEMGPCKQTNQGAACQRPWRSQEGLTIYLVSEVNDGPCLEKPDQLSIWGRNQAFDMPSNHLSDHSLERLTLIITRLGPPLRTAKLFASGRVHVVVGRRSMR